MIETYKILNGKHDILLGCGSFLSNEKSQLEIINKKLSYR